MKKSILVLLAMVTLVVSSCERPLAYFYFLQNNLTDSLTIKQVKGSNLVGMDLMVNQYNQICHQTSSSDGLKWEVTFNATPEKCDAILFTYKGKTYREERRGGYSALNSAVYSKFTEPYGYWPIDQCFVFNITEAYLATLPEVTD